MRIKQLAAQFALLTCLAGVNATPATEGSSSVVPDYVLIETKQMVEVMLQNGSYREDNVVDRSTLKKRADTHYIRFDKNDPTDRKHIQQLEQGKKDAIHLAAWMANKWDNAVGSGIYGHYFPTADKDKVVKVYQNIYGGSVNTGSVNLLWVFWYTVAEVSGQEQIQKFAIAHACPQAYELPEIKDVSCEELDEEVGGEMMVLGSVLLHEYTHFKLIGEPAIGQHITDVKDKNDKAIGYGALATRKLTDAQKTINADNYHWLALEYYWTTTCGKTFEEPTENICAPGSCVIQ
ncbi:hypothetical protein M406DRAFT_328222 [Cryphonectria parasitica EP155]|uniref:Lysine-specific metallo-endopeptidase domain-containing protein n=1 Tax=Cryphonectria parasitica (strain ATCC 38755 / EP155) TaxID=660469 RepID=A0A9P5CRC1_CRYP1|nr:uncharacterized protein M406DRAFT_328222 [Cryphonectria parasitica EP155]KAF3767121.1 hypothetical protein M406DRAFT_328222 [Cryphonectria parasitica EP155]